MISTILFKSRSGMWRGFTLVELLVSMVILAILAWLIFSITGTVSRMWKDSTNAIGEWQSARTGFEAMTRRISQATLNTTWAYFDGPGGTGNLTTDNPKSYGRYSELQFVSGNAAQLLPGVADVLTQGVFFQAPLGKTRNSDLRGLPYLLNATGFFVQFNSDANFRPTGDIFQNVEDKRRFRLMELLEPSEDLKVYSSGTTADFRWFLDPVKNGTARPLAENVIGLFVLPKYSRFDTATGSALAPDYFYNSRQNFQFIVDGKKANTLHQLPPLLQVTMVALSEDSAKRLDREYLGQPPTSLFDGAPFLKAEDFDRDMAQFEANLNAKRLRYRIFSSVIAIRGAKWSGDLP